MSDPCVPGRRFEAVQKGDEVVIIPAITHGPFERPYLAKVKRVNKHDFWAGGTRWNKYGHPHGTSGRDPLQAQCDLAERHQGRDFAILYGKREALWRECRLFLLRENVRRLLGRIDALSEDQCRRVLAILDEVEND